MTTENKVEHAFQSARDALRTLELELLRVARSAKTRRERDSVAENVLEFVESANRKVSEALVNYEDDISSGRIAENSNVVEVDSEPRLPHALQAIAAAADKDVYAPTFPWPATPGMYRRLREVRSMRHLSAKDISIHTPRTTLDEMFLQLTAEEQQFVTQGE